MIVALITFFIFHTFGVLIEQELKIGYQKYSKSSDFQSKYLINDEFTEDSVQSLLEMDSLLVKHMLEIGLPEQNVLNSPNKKSFLGSSSSCSASPPSHAEVVLARLQQVQGQQHSQPPKMFKFNSILTHSIEMKYLRCGLYYSFLSLSRRKTEKLQYEKFYFQKVSRFFEFL
jgi:hypothetical protein